MIHGGIDEELRGQRDTFIAQPLRDDGREIAARAVAGDADIVVSAQLVRMRHDPLRGRDGIFNAGGKCMLGRQPVVHRHHHGHRAATDLAADVVVRVQVANDESAAVVGHGRKRPVAFGPVHAGLQWPGGAADVSRTRATGTTCSGVSAPAVVAR